MPMFTFEHQSPDRLSQFAESLANYHYSPLKRQARHDCRHDNIRPARASSKYTKSSAQNGYVAEQVVAGANPRRSHVRVRSKVRPQQAKRDAVRNEGSNSNSAHCCRSGERGARHLDRGKLSGTIGARQGVGGEIMESGHGGPMSPRAGSPGNTPASPAIGFCAAGRSCRWQAANCPASIGRNAGSSALQRSNT